MLTTIGRRLGALGVDTVCVSLLRIGLFFVAPAWFPNQITIPGDTDIVPRIFNLCWGAAHLFGGNLILATAYFAVCRYAGFQQTIGQHVFHQREKTDSGKGTLSWKTFRWVLLKGLVVGSLVSAVSVELPFFIVNSMAPIFHPRHKTPPPDLIAEKIDRFSSLPESVSEKEYDRILSQPAPRSKQRSFTDAGPITVSFLPPDEKHEWGGLGYHFVPIPNLQSSFIKLQLDHAYDAWGKDILARPSYWMEGRYFFEDFVKNPDLVLHPHREKASMVANDKVLQMFGLTRPWSDVATLHGQIFLTLPVDILTVEFNASPAIREVRAGGMRIRFWEMRQSLVRWSFDGPRDHLLWFDGFNAKGQKLQLCDSGLNEDEHPRLVTTYFCGVPRAFRVYIIPRFMKKGYRYSLPIEGVKR